MLALCVMTSLALGTSTTPQEAVEQVVQDIRAFHHTDEGPLSAEQKAQNRQLSGSLNGALDIDGLAQRVLAGQWQKLGKAERKQFSEMLASLFAHVAYPNAGKFFGDLQLDLQPTPKTGVFVLGPPEITVIGATLSHPDEGLVEIDFALSEVNGQWKVVDVVLDGVSLGLDIRAQMQKILNEDGYAELKRRMREKLKDESVG